MCREAWHGGAGRAAPRGTADYGLCHLFLRTAYSLFDPVCHTRVYVVTEKCEGALVRPLCSDVCVCAHQQVAARRRAWL